MYRPLTNLRLSFSSLVEIFGDEGWMRSTSIYILIQGNLLGLMEIAGAMADPFGKSAVQFMACLPPVACCLLPELFPCVLRC